MTQSVMSAPRALTFSEELHEQRWDDHRLYHRSYVNQALHLLSALCFLTTYVMIPLSPITAAFFGWCVAMWPRQIGHFWFEPKGFDDVNQISFDDKESAKVGFNLQRKVMLFVTWLSVPVLVKIAPELMTALTGQTDFVHNLAVAWLGLAALGLLGRTTWLIVFRGPQTGLVWMTKILTDPFHDIKMYHRAPLHLLRGERIDPLTHA